MPYLVAHILLAMPLNVLPQSAPAMTEARTILARFEKNDPGWKVRMESLVRLVKTGPVVVPTLIDGLKSTSASVREFAAHGLMFFPDPSLRPALDEALNDKHWAVRMYAIHALSMLGPLPHSEMHEQILAKDPSFYGVRTLMAAALERTERPDPAELRKALASYDLRQMDNARIGEIAPDFTLADFNGKPYQLSKSRGKIVVLRFILFDF